MATFKRDLSGTWSTPTDPRPVNVGSYWLAAVLLIGLASLVLIQPLLAGSSHIAEPLPRPAVAFPNGRSLVSPTYGQIKLGAFAGEAGNLAGISQLNTSNLAKPDEYKKYRESILAAYGVDLEDMNYFSLAPSDFDSRVQKLGEWILLAGEYGDVTLALEPLGPEKYGVFTDSIKMAQLSAIFTSAKQRNITIWIRFASESNLRGSEFSCVKDGKMFRSAATAFKRQMPSNVKLVLSPLINTYIAGGNVQKSLAKEMIYGPTGTNEIWDRIGGTIYRTDRSLTPMYKKYYRDLSQIAPNTPFQVCELGGPYSRRAELLEFLQECSEGKYPNLEKVNLFARNINRRADPGAEFGFMEPGARAVNTLTARRTGTPQLQDSFLKPVLLSSR